MGNPHYSGLKRSPSLGFSLLELMIVVAIIAVLAAIAIPSYESYVVKTNRSAAEGCLSQYASYMERFYTTNLRYDETPAASGTAAGTPNPVIGTTGATSGAPTLVLDCAGTAQTGNNYEYSVPTPSATSYVIKAIPINAQLTRDTQCGTLSLDQIGTRSSSSGTVAQCWGG
ncbi:MAG: prepilin-type N-terminal cleavage/methylation domain-containing protein [Xanthomonadaceae bacterium]|jgi:type IV pilus assembly protein PilE|nr:prepilin-type N-terminal cleavage/methylation domain-containing protein [Xanthomonadaceae bacterium]